MRRYDGNPIFVAADSEPGTVLVFNPGVIRIGNDWMMTYRADLGTWGDPNIVGTSIGVARSEDGLTWRDAPELQIDRTRLLELLAPLEPHADLARQVWRAYDPRLTAIMENGKATLVLTMAVDTTRGLRTCIATSEDGLTWNPKSFCAPDNRNQVLFPERIDGRLHRLERPMPTYGGVAMGAHSWGVWTSSSDDLLDWGRTRFVTGPESFPFANDKIGPGAPPLRTEAGWLCLLHGVSKSARSAKRGWEISWDRTYEAGAMLLDLDDPSHVIAAAGRPLLSPSDLAPYETHGFRNDVIFPTAAVITEEGGRDMLRMYYGAADTSIAVASAPLDDVLEFVTASDAASRGEVG